MVEEWSKTKLAKKLAIHTRRSQLNDFERFQVMVLRRQVCEDCEMYRKLTR